MKSLEEAKEMMKLVYLPEGEVRSYCQCMSCGNVMIREYIPYRLGEGRTYNPCSCWLTNGHTVRIKELETINSDRRVDGGTRSDNAKHFPASPRC